MPIFKFRVKGLTVESEFELERILKVTHGIASVETNGEKGLARVVARENITLADIEKALIGSVFVIEKAPARVMDLAIDGMKCQSCEIRIEKKLKCLPGIQKVSVNSTNGTAKLEYEGEIPAADKISKLLAEDGYKLHGEYSEAFVKPEKSSWYVVLGFLVLAFVFGKILSSLGLFETSLTFGDQTTFFSAFMVGLVAASSSCIAVSGGVMLSTITAWSAAHPHAGRAKKLVPVSFFIAGRLISYAILGAAIGAVGSALQLPPWAMGAIAMLAALYMIVFGLDMLGIAPGFLKKLLPRMPKFLGHQVLAAESSQSFAAPLLLGAATFFLPCGFTQALQLYALTTGSAFRSGMLLFGFALGTAPALVILGTVASSVKGRTAGFFYRFAGAAVFLLGIWTVQNSLIAAGFSLPHIEFQQQADNLVEGATDPNVVMENGEQVIRLKLGIEPAYTPSDHYTVKAGIPVRMEIEGVGTGCRSIFQIPKFNVRTALNSQHNTIRFTPTVEGSAVFSCSMGMFPGTLRVVKG
ncbi:MAG: sulfite exporter TauE/SafE family protein [bacterium]